MSAHVSVFDLKRFAEARLQADELPAFERHLASCGECASRLQRAATRQLRAQGVVLEAPERSMPATAALIAFAASVLVVLSLGRPPVRFSPSSKDVDPVGLQGSMPSAGAAADAGMIFDGGEQR